MSTSNKMAALPSLKGAAHPEVGPEPGPQAALAALQALVRFRRTLYPRTLHTERYLRKQLDGEKPMPLDTFDAFVDRVLRCCGRSVAARVLNAWLQKYGFVVADASTQEPQCADVATQLLDVSVAAGRVVSFIDAARRNGLGEDDRRKAAPLLDQAEAELQQLRQAVSR